MLTMLRSYSALAGLNDGVAIKIAEDAEKFDSAFFESRHATLSLSFQPGTGNGTFTPATSQDACPKTSPQSGAAFGFWHPNLVTMHVWLWYANPSGLYSGTNPLVTPFNEG